MLHAAADPSRLNGCGLIVANPPYTLYGQLAAVLPTLQDRLADGSGPHYRLDLLARADKSQTAPAADSQRRKAPKPQKAER
jgi:23S rRNA (adenine2030-N6)-methyltransferase